MKNNDLFWEWTPLVSFGIFEFGMPLRNYRRLRPIWLNAIFFPPAPECNTDSQLITYTLPKYLKSRFIQINVDYQGLIDSVRSEKIFLYKGYNLMNMKINEIENILGESFDKRKEYEIFGDIYYVYEYYNFGLCIWEVNQTIDSIIASSAYDD